MQLYPAIDLKNGQCVRLRQGAFSDVTVYSDAPWEIAQKWETAGGTYLHVVDLDGALKGHGVNRETIAKIVSSVHMPVQLGGGIRTAADIEETLGLGVSRVIIGTKAVENPQFIADMITRFGASRIVIGIDAKNGMVAVEGWEKVSQLTAVELGMQMKELGVQTIVYTDISKDGMLQGPNLTATKELSDRTGIDIIASGGMSRMEDLEQIDAARIHGAIIGKALYEGRIDLTEAVLKFEQKQGRK